jgi:hypothetical protein
VGGDAPQCVHIAGFGQLKYQGLEIVSGEAILF